MKKFKFSRSGNLFVIAGSMDLDIIHVYDSSNIESLLSEKVSKGTFISALQAAEIKDTKRVVFSNDEEKLFIGTNRQILVFKIKDGKLLQNIPIPHCYGK